MADTRTFRSGSHEAQHLMRRGEVPLQEFGMDLVFATMGEGVGEDRVPGWVIARHHQRRFHRYMRYAIAAALVLLPLYLWYRVEEHVCVRNYLCAPTPWSAVDNIGLLAVGAMLLAAAMFMVANNHGRRAARLEEAAALKKRFEPTPDFPRRSRWGD